MSFSCLSLLIMAHYFSGFEFELSVTTMGYQILHICFHTNAREAAMLFLNFNIVL